MNEQEPAFRFVNFREIVGVHQDSPTEWNRTWLRAKDFSEHEKEQLADVMSESGCSEDPFTCPCSTFGGLATAGIEIWDIVDATGALTYRLWMYDCDSGRFYPHDSAEPIAEIIQFGAEFEDEELGEELDNSLWAQKRSELDAKLPRFNFDSD